MARKTGAATGTVFTSPAKAKRLAAKRRGEEQKWANMAGPVTVSRVADKTPRDGELPTSVD
jgi:hypothetical protein